MDESNMDAQPTPTLLAHVLSAQSVFSVLSSETRLAEFVVRLIRDIPGVNKVACCLKGFGRPVGDFDGQTPCKRCPVRRGDTPSNGTSCELASRQSLHAVPLSTMENVYGFLLIDASDSRLWELHESVVVNLAGLAAFVLENRWQKAAMLRLGTELRETEARLQASAADQAELVCRTLPDGRITFVNDAFCHIFGCKAADIVGRRFAPPIPAEDRVMIERRVEELQIQDPVCDYEHRVIMPDGEVRWQRWTCRALIGPDGRVTEFHSIGHDVTDIKKAEEALGRAQDEWERTFDAIPDLVALIDEDFRIVRANRAMARRLETSPEECRGLLCFQCVHGTNSPPSICPLSKLLLDGQEHTEELYEPRLHAHFLVSATPMLDSTGRLIGSIHVARDITSLKMAEEELKVDQDRFETLYRFSQMFNEPEAVIKDFALEAGVRLTKSTIGYLYFVSEDESVLTLHAWSKGVMPQCTMDFKPTEYRAADTGLWGEALRQRTPVITNDYDAPNPNKKGYPVGHVPVKRHMNIPLIENDRVVLIAGVGNKEDEYTEADVTQLTLVMAGMWRIVQRKRAEDALRITEERFELAVQGSNDGIWDWPDVSRDEQWWSPLCYGLIGYEEGELTPSLFQLRALTHPDDAPRARSTLQDHLENRTPYDIEYRLRTKTGEYRWFRVRGQALWDDEGKPVRMTGSLRDVTERKNGEARLAHLAKVVEQASEEIMITETDGRITYVNPAFEHVTGYSGEEVIGQNPRLLKSGLHDEAFYKDMWDTLLSGGVWKGRLTNKRKDGDIFEEDATITAIRDAKEEVIGYVGIKRDVTEQVRLEEQLRQAQKMEALGTLAGGIAHDFNNILGAIIGYTEIAREQAAQDRPVDISYLDEVLIAGERARGLVQQILTFSRRTKHEKVPVQASTIAEEALKLLKSVLPATIEIKKELTPNADTVLADPTQIHQVVMNLCTNAWHAMKDEGGVLDVRLEPADISLRAPEQVPDLHPGEYVKLTVSDTGRGIPKPNLERIFEPFFTTKEVGKGTGMGLAVVHGIVKEHGGSISIQSEEGMGTVCEVFLPRMISEEVGIQDSEQPLPTGVERIMLVDDEDSLLRVGSRMLDSLGYEVVTKQSGAAALDDFLAAPQEFDLIITDLAMPKMTGLELAGRVLKARPDMPIILCTGFSETITPEKAKELHFREMQLKPLRKRELAECVRRVLDKATPERL